MSNLKAGLFALLILTIICVIFVCFMIYPGITLASIIALCLVFCIWMILFESIKGK